MPQMLLQLLPLLPFFNDSICSTDCEGCVPAFGYAAEK